MAGRRLGRRDQRLLPLPLNVLLLKVPLALLPSIVVLVCGLTEMPLFDELWPVVVVLPCMFELELDEPLMPDVELSCCDEPLIEPLLPATEPDADPEGEDDADPEAEPDGEPEAEPEIEPEVEPDAELSGILLSCLFSPWAGGTPVRLAASSDLPGPSACFELIEPRSEDWTCLSALSALSPPAMAGIAKAALAAKRAPYRMDFFIRLLLMWTIPDQRPRCVIVPLPEKSLIILKSRALISDGGCPLMEGNRILELFYF
jgi:hypothetical protein